MQQPLTKIDGLFDVAQPVLRRMAQFLLKKFTADSHYNVKEVL
jgi:hypothetical protein